VVRHPLILSFRPEISIVDEPDGSVTLQSPSGRAVLPDLSTGFGRVLRLLASDGATEEALVGLVEDSDDSESLARLYYHLQRFRDLGFLRYSITTDVGTLATVVPMTRGYDPLARGVSRDASCRLSRFVYMRRDGDVLALESPLSVAKVLLTTAAGTTLVGELARPRTHRQLCDSVHLSEPAVQLFLDLLASAGMVAEVGDDGRLAEDVGPTLRQWEFHDLLFHSRSRIGRHTYPVGGTFRFLGEIAPLPAVKANEAGEITVLDRPDLDTIAQREPSFTCVAENRRSIRDYASAPITVRQLGEFLYRVARVRSIADPELARGQHYQASKRPYPSGGATYDLELYVTVNACEGLAVGLYHYDPLNHQLRRRAGRTSDVERLLRDARFAAALRCDPQILLTLASRFQRLSWKYSAIAYATTLKNVGVLYQMMYLTATAMGLAPCALGAGDSALFASAAGTDYFAESSVGEFLLGSAVPSPSAL
jgi:SagB-type dehydrogenase family enzyme